MTSSAISKNFYQEMQEGPAQAAALSASIIQDPVGYELRMCREMVEDPVGLVRSYQQFLAQPQQLTGLLLSPEGIGAMLQAFAVTSRRPPALFPNFDEKLIEILHTISVDTIYKVGDVFQTVLQSLKDTGAIETARSTLNIGAGSSAQVPPGLEAMVLAKLGSMGSNIRTNWPAEAQILEECTRAEDIVEKLLKGKVIPHLQATPTLPNQQSQLARLTYVKEVFAAAAIKIRELGLRPEK